jgi:peptidoglycan hydrolase-like protein with peptidoglycan-binding domain
MKKHFLASLLTVLLVLPVISLAQTDEDIDPITTANTCTNLTYDLRITSRDSQTGGQVSDLQFFLQTKGYLNTEPTGYFGLLTATAVKQFQTANSISPLGYVGPLTRTKINSISCNNISSGTANPTAPTNTTTSSIVGCTPGALFSSTTGAPCSTIATTVVTPTIQSTSSQVSSSYQGYIFSNNLTLNDKGTDVLMLQSFLEAKGFFAKSSYLKGTFDVNTKKALAKYQASVGISPAEGDFGPITRKTLNANISSSVPISTKVIQPSTNLTGNASINISSPNGGEILTSGETFRIKWTSNGFAIGNILKITSNPSTFGNSNMMIDLVDQKGFTIKTIAPSDTFPVVPNDGIEDWTIPLDIKSGQYKIQITCQTCGKMNNGQGVWDLSDNYFTINNSQTSTGTSTTGTNSYASGPFVILTSQASDEEWDVGKQYQIKWNHIYPELSGKLHALLVSDTAVPSDNTYCDLGYADIKNSVLTVTLGLDTKCNKQGYSSVGLIRGKYRLHLYDEQVVPTTKGGYQIATSKGFVNVISGNSQILTSNLRISATQASNGTVHIDVSSGSNSYDSLAIYLKAICPVGVIVSNGYDVCSNAIRMPEIVGPGTYRSAFTFSNTTDFAQTITFQAGLNGFSGTNLISTSITLSPTATNTNSTL